MGHDAHWFSDVVGAALLGVGTTELFIWLHNRHDEEPGRWRIFSMSEAGPRLAGAQPFSSVGLGVAYNW
jgi:membrane-associated phospholipid phosphatase